MSERERFWGRQAVLLACVGMLSLATAAVGYSAATDDFANLSSTHSSPAVHGIDITPNDSADLTKVTRGIYVGTTGDIKVTMAGGETLTYHSVPVGLWPWRVTRVWSTGTTASNLEAQW